MLNIDRTVIVKAKRYAKRCGISLSEVVEAYLAHVPSDQAPSGEVPPILRSVRGVLKKREAADYRSFIEAKYR